MCRKVRTMASQAYVTRFYKVPKVVNCNSLFIYSIISWSLESNYIIYLIMWYVDILLRGFIYLFSRIWLKIE